MNNNDFDLHVFITHFIPPKTSFRAKIMDFLLPRMKLEYLRSWARLVKHGTRGFQPWKKDIMTKPRRLQQSERDSKLAEVVRVVESIEASTINFYIYTNSDFRISTTSKKSSICIKVFNQYDKFNTRNNSPWTDDYIKSPWNLLWEHKKDLIDFSRQEIKRKRIFLILENDVLFTGENLEYWLENRGRLRKVGLIPSFLRIEYEKNFGKWICIDVHDSAFLDKVNKMNFENSEFMQLPSLYSGLTVLDDELLMEYVNSKAIKKDESKGLIWWDLGARASMGVQFVQIPEGFSDRHVIGLSTTFDEIDKRALVHHLPNLYSSVRELADKYTKLDQLNEHLCRDIHKQ